MRLKPTPTTAYQLAKTVATLALAALFCTFATPAAFAQGANVLTFHNDPARTGQNLNETILTPANVNSSSFGRLFSYPVDGEIYAQPLIVSGLAINGATHNVVYVVTQNDSVYAFDSDSSGASGGLLWQTNFLNPSVGVTTVSTADVGTADITPQIGITSTPVIDTTANTIFVSAETKENGAFVHRLHALSLTTGAEQPNSPVVIAASVPGTGNGSSNGSVVFDDQTALQRPGLALLNGVVYIAFGSNGSISPYHGWVIGYNETTLAQTFVLNTTPNADKGGIWMGGCAPAIDAYSNMYFATGNGTFDANTGGSDFGDTLYKLAPGTSPAPVSSFTPYNQADLEANDKDLGSGGLALLPDSVGSAAHPHLMADFSKLGVLYLVDRDNMGGYNSGTDNVVQEIGTGSGRSTPAYFNNSLYLQGVSAPLQQYSFSFTGGISNGSLISTPASVGIDAWGYPSSTPSISANGTTAAIVWIVNSSAYSSLGPETLYAYDATNLANKLYDTTQVAARDTPGPAVKFVVPTVANGKVYLGTHNQLSVYGLNPGPYVLTPVINASGATTGSTITITDSTPGASLYYTLDGTMPTQNSLPYTESFLMTNPGYVTAQAFYPGSLSSVIAVSPFFSSPRSPGNGDGLYAQYFDNTQLNSPATITRIDPSINYPAGWPNGTPGTGIGTIDWSAEWTGQVQAEFTDTYAFSVSASNGARLFVNGVELGNSWSNDSSQAIGGTVALTAGQFYPITVQYTYSAGKSLCVLSWSSSHFLPETIGQPYLFSGSQLPIPTITPNGGAFTGPQPASLTDLNPGASIYYTLDGSIPSTASPLFSTPLSLASNTTVNAIASLPGFAQSAVTTAKFWFTPTITNTNPANGIAGNTVTITGTNLSGASSVVFGGAPATFTVVSPTYITATVPSGIVGTMLSITTPGGTATGTFAALPSTTTALSCNINPSAVGQTVTFTAKVTGTGPAPTGTVTFYVDNVAKTTVTLVNSAATYARGSLTAGAHSIIATYSGDSANLPNTSNNWMQNISASIPTITAISPSSAVVGATITITGMNLTGTQYVSFGGVHATTYTVVSATTVTAVVPVGAVQFPITLATPSGGASSPTAFTPLNTPLPTISSFTLSSPNTYGGSSTTANIVLSFAGTIAATVTFASNNAAMPTKTYAIPAGSTTGSTSLIPLAVSSPTLVTVTATLNGSSAIQTVTVNPLALHNITASASTIEGGVTSPTLTINMNGKAYSGGATIALSSNNPAVLAVPSATVVVPAGSTSLTIPLTSFAVTSTKKATISATYAGVTDTYGISVTAP